MNCFYENSVQTPAEGIFNKSVKLVSPKSLTMGLVSDWAQYNSAQTFLPQVPILKWCLLNKPPYMSPYGFSKYGYSGNLEMLLPGGLTVVS